jgi:hypothetical protein
VNEVQALFTLFSRVSNSIVQVSPGPPTTEALLVFWAPAEADRRRVGVCL